MKPQTLPAPAQSLADYCASALARAEARHAANGLDQFAGFTFDPVIKRYVVTVMRHTVATLRTVAEVRAFCMMHNRVY